MKRLRNLGSGIVRSPWPMKRYAGAISRRLSVQRAIDSIENKRVAVVLAIYLVCVP
jgi:hypothetical protein